MATTLYLRSVTNGLTGLPTTEQSTRTSANDFEADQSTNRLLSTTIGTAQTSLANASTATTSQTDYYIGRWVTPALNQTSVAANTWTVNIAFKESNIAALFPVNGGNPLYVNVYVWKPSNSTKYGTIYDGATSNVTFGPQSGVETNDVVTFSGSAVSSLTAGDAVIVFELWAKVTQSSATSYTQTVYFDGATVTAADNTTVSNHASLVSTPENLVFITSKLYLHNTTSGLPSGTLPSAEQSTKTVTTACNFEGSQTTNRLMDTTKGTSQASLALSTPTNTNANVYYVSRWVTPVLGQTSIVAGDWEYNFAAAESNTSANFPVNSTNKAVAICCYVWKPSNGTKYGDILDGNTAATYSEGAAATEISEHGRFTGAAVASLTAGDACIVFEAWFNVTQTGSTGYTATYYYDGTTETLTTGTTVSNHASFLNFIGDGTLLNFTTVTNFNRPLTAETISISESVIEIYGANRAPSAQTTTIGEAIARQFVGIRALGTETNTIGESIARVFGVNRALATETTTIGETLARLFGANRALSAETTAISEAIAKVQVLVRALSAETVTVGESLARLLSKIKALSDTTAISESITRVFVGVRALATETNTIGESLARLKAATRAVSDTTTIGESLARILGAIRSLSDTTVIGESLARTYNAIRALATQTVSVSEVLAKVQTLVRSLADTIVISETLARVYNGIRALATEIITIGESLTKVHTPAGGAFFDRPLAAQTVAISESVARAITNVRSLSQTTAISESLSRLIVVVRSLSDTTAITETLTRMLSAIRSLSDTTAISESLTRILGIVRSLSVQTTTINESLTTLKVLTRALIETVIISETLDRLQTLTRILSTQITVITESLTAFYATGAQIRSLVETVIISEVLTRAQTLTRALTENTVISAILEALKEIIIPLYKKPTEAIRPEGVGERNRSMERESPLYLRKQLARIVRRVGSLGRWRNSIG